MGMLVTLAALFAAAHTCYADTPKTLCTVTDYKVLNYNSIIVQCAEGNTSGISGSNGTVYLGTDLTPASVLPVKLTANPYLSNWLLLVFTPNSFTANSGPMERVLQGGKKYTISIMLTRTVKDAQDSTPIEKGSTSTQIDTSGSLTLAAAFDGTTKYEVSSHLEFQGLGLGTRKEQPCTLVVQNFTGTHINRRAKCMQSQYEFPDHPGLLDPDSVGLLILQPQGNDVATQGIPYEITELQDVLDTPLTLDPKSRLGQNQAPATKDASSYYINGSFAAGRGSKPGWVLDAKVAPPIGRLYGGWQFAPTVMANIGNNTVSGTTYTDSIDFGLTEARPFRLTGVLQEIYASGSLLYDTDREFDRENITGVADLRYNFKGLYSPRAVETLKKFSKEQTIAKTHGITLQQSDVTPPFLGYALDIHTGVEFGSAIVDTTVKATTGKATIDLPAYSIFRVVPQAHGLLELGRFSVDTVGTARYLVETENTVIQLPNNSLQLKTVHGWHGYGVLTSAWSFDPAGHFSLCATYKDGFAPTKFSRINAVQLGILMKY